MEKTICLMRVYVCGGWFFSLTLIQFVMFMNGSFASTVMMMMMICLHFDWNWIKLFRTNESVIIVNICRWWCFPCMNWDSFTFIDSLICLFIVYLHNSTFSVSICIYSQNFLFSRKIIQMHWNEFQSLVPESDVKACATW